MKKGKVDIGLPWLWRISIVVIIVVFMVGIENSFLKSRSDTQPLEDRIVSTALRYSKSCLASVDVYQNVEPNLENISRLRCCSSARRVRSGNNQSRDDISDARICL